MITRSGDAADDGLKRSVRTTDTILEDAVAKNLFQNARR